MIPAHTTYAIIFWDESQIETSIGSEVISSRADQTEVIDRLARRVLGDRYRVQQAFNLPVPFRAIHPSGSQVYLKDPAPAPTPTHPCYVASASVVDVMFNQLEYLVAHGGRDCPEDCPVCVRLAGVKHWLMLPFNEGSKQPERKAPAASAYPVVTEYFTDALVRVLGAFPDVPR